uniref:Uncharacterized protein n=1 Tax=Xenopus tropicalis TaxID=8364 RepID=A0A6I8T0G3_XENTR
AFGSRDNRYNLLTPVVLFNETASSATISCRGFTTGIPIIETTRIFEHIRGELQPHFAYFIDPTRCNKLGFIFFIPNFLILHISPRKEKSHHPVKELVRQLDGEGNHIDL